MRAIYLGTPDSSAESQLHEGEVCEVYTSFFSSELYDIVFADDYKLYDVSGEYLRQVK